MGGLWAMNEVLYMTFFFLLFSFFFSHASFPLYTNGRTSVHREAIIGYALNTAPPVSDHHLPLTVVMQRAQREVMQRPKHPLMYHDSHRQHCRHLETGSGFSGAG